MKRTTIKDVAKEAKVSVATVSRALNDPEAVKKDTRDRVLEAVKNLNYDPDPIAQALRSNSVKSIAIIVPNITNAIMAEMTRGAHEKLAEKGYNTVLFNSDDNIQQENHYCEILPNSMVDGAIFVTGSGGTPPVEKIADNLAVCLINREIEVENVDQVTADEKEGLQLLAYHLHRLGHDKIAFITGLDITSATQRKINGYKEFINKTGLDYKENYIISGQWTMNGAYMAMKELLGSKERPTAVIVGTDTMALGALSAVRDSGLKVPEDIAVTGFDNAPGSEYYQPPLTTLKYPNYEMGQLAARAILNRLKDPDVDKKSIKLPLDITVRKSCGYRLGFDSSNNR